MCYLYVTIAHCRIAELTHYLQMNSYCYGLSLMSCCKLNWSLEVFSPVLLLFKSKQSLLAPAKDLSYTNLVNSKLWTITSLQQLRGKNLHPGKAKRTQRLGDIKIGIPIKVIKTATAGDLLKIVASFKLAFSRTLSWLSKKKSTNQTHVEGFQTAYFFPHICRLLKTSMLIWIASTVLAFTQSIACVIARKGDKKN